MLDKIFKLLGSGSGQELSILASGYTDGELDEKDRALVESKLQEGDLELLSELESHEALGQGLKSWMNEKLSHESFSGIEFWSRVESQISARETIPVRGTFSWPAFSTASLSPVPAFAALVLLVASTYIYSTKFQSASSLSLIPL
ncbi:hypothetical protein BVY02_02475 [bacterium J17]|nr:hypothetical protein BVY02_02475 [bacterium J17]